MNQKLNQVMIGWRRVQEYKRRDLLGKIVGVEERLFFLLIERVHRGAVGRARQTYGRKVELAQLALSRQQTASAEEKKKKNRQISIV